MALRNKIYYPKTHIVNNLHTSGKEWMFVDGIEYIGYYHKYIDGKVLSGAVFNRTESKTLIPYINQIEQPENIIYNSLKIKQSYVSPRHSLPIPVVDDYRNGSFNRYFLRRRNYTTYQDIIEIDQPQYKLWRKSQAGIDETLYQALVLEWKLTGPVNDNNSGTNIEYGVYDTNQRLVFLKDYDMPGLKDYLTDYIELSIYSPYVSDSIKNIFGYVK